MTRANSKTRQLLVSLLCVLLVFTMIPTVAMPAYAADYIEVADTSTLDGWKNVFGDPNSNNISTENAGKVWTDKSVFTDSLTSGNTTVTADKSNSLLVALSAMASNTSKAGVSNVPTDTMLILDVSGSMNDDSNDMAEEMVDAANDSIATLLAANPHNRVGVVVYSGTSSSNTNNDAAITVLPLGRYTTAADGNYLSYSRSSGWGSSTEYVSVDTDTRIEGTNNRPTAASKEVVGATYIQKGIILAMNQLTGVQDTTATDPVFGTVKRIPVMVLMSDGAPTLSSTEFTAPGQYNLGNGQSSSTSAQQVFVSQLSAAYAKYQIESNYNNDSLFYTLGLGVGNDSYALSVLNPTQSIDDVDDFWTEYNALDIGERIRIQGNSNNNSRYVTKIEEPIEQNYVDRYFNVANMNADDLNNAFKDIVDDIQLQSRYFPTLVSGDEELDGYVSFVDRIGKYMHVSDIKGIMIHDTMFTGADLASNFVTGGGDLGSTDNPTALGDEMVWAVQARLGIDTVDEARALIGMAYQYGQLSYTSPTEFSNYIGWYSNAAGEYVGFWYDGITTAAPEGATHIVKSYGYLGEVDEEHGVTKSDMMYVTVQHRTEIATGEETMTFAVPAALIPTVTYEIELDDAGNLESLDMTGATSPIRLVYEVALDEGINEFTIADVVDADYLAANTDEETGDVYFYTNQFEADNTTGYGKVNTYSYFNPSRQNELYYYTENATVYTNTIGTEYTGTTQPEGTYYRQQVVYEKNGTDLVAKLVYRPFTSDVLGTAVQASDGTWYVAAGTVHTDLARFTAYKNPSGGNTDTLTYVAQPFVDTHNHDVDETGYSYIIGSTLGNNGRIAVTPVTGIAISKDVTVANTTDGAPTEFEFTITGQAADAGKTYEAILEAADGTRTETTVEFDSNSKATVELEDGETIYIIGMTAGVTYTINETETKYYKLTTDNDVKVTTVGGQIVEANFINAARGEGSLTITKEVAHDFAQAPSGLTSKKFTMTVTLEGIDVKNATFDAITTPGETATTVRTDANGQFTVELADNEQIRILGLPEGTKATIVEEDPGEGFTESYWENGAAGDGIVDITAGMAQSVIVVNEYEPSKVYPVNVVLSGTKTYEQQWNGATFEIKLQKWNGTAWTDLATTSVSENDRTYNFDDVLSKEEFSEPGTYYYQVIETKGGTTEDGITYDPTLHTFGIAVDDENLDGQLEIVRVISYHTGEDFPKNDNDDWQITANFVNTYDADGCTVAIDILKDILNPTNSPLASKAGFQFELLENGQRVAVSDYTDGVGEARLIITYDKDDVADLDDGQSKTYTYTLKEIVPSPAKDGYTYTDATYTVTVTVTASNGTTSATAVVTDAQGAAVADNIPVFTNTYDLDDATIDLEERVGKTIEGRDLVAGEFTFEIRNSQTNTVVATGTNNADGYVVFDGGNKLTFDKVGTYFYDVRETSADGNGVTTDKTVYNVTITVTDDGNGKLKVDYIVTNLVDNEHIVFNNVYEAGDATWQITGNKTLTVYTSDKKLLDNEFVFQMVEADESGNALEGGQTWTVSNAADGTITFPEMTFDKAGDYYFAVTELDGGFNYITHDTSKYLIKVTVTDDLEGTLTATHTVTKGGETAALAFENKYIPDPTSAILRGNKVLENKTLAAGAFGFNLYASDDNWTEGAQIGETVKNDADGRFSFEAINYDKAGDYYYLIKEAIPQDAVDGVKDGITYDTEVYRVKVEVRDNERGQLGATVHYYYSDGFVSGVPTFTNTYNTTPAEVTLDIAKTLTGRDMEDGEFTFRLLYHGGEQDGEMVREVVNNEAADGEKDSISFEKLVFSEAGTYNYRIVEVVPFDAVSGIKDGVKYDTAVYYVTIVVTDNGHGEMEASDPVIKDVSGNAATPEFNNTYTTGSEVSQLTGVEKVLTGRDMNAREVFKFVLKDVATNDVVAEGETKVLGQDGKAIEVVFEEITYTEDGTYNYIVEEVAGNADGVTYSTEKYNVSITVTDDGAGNLIVGTPVFTKVGETATSDKAVFTNVYEADPVDVNLVATKTLNGKTLAKDDFSFKLTLTDAPSGSGLTAGEVETVKNGNAADKTVNDIVFETLTFDTVGTYVFEIKEVVPGDADNNVKEGITYDSSTITVTIEVTDNKNGELEAEVVYTENGADVGKIAFTNDYSAKPVKVAIEADKTLVGGTLEGDDFEFELYEGLTLVDTAKNDADGKVVFEEITYDKVGTHTYTVKEKVGTDTTINYDTAVKTVTVVVTDNEKGQLVATVNGEASTAQDPVEFTNYDPADTKAAIDFVTKVLTGRDMKADEFTFNLALKIAPAGVETKAEWNQTAKNVAAADGKESAVTFTDIPFDAEGIYVFEITEENGNDTIDNVKYSDAAYRVTIEVSYDSENNKLVAAEPVVEKLVSGSAVEVDDATFENVYTPTPVEGDFMINVFKNLEGRDMDANEFVFNLVGEDIELQGKNVAGENGESVKVQFPNIKYTEKGTYEYTITEVDSQAGGVGYSKDVYNVTITVTDNGKGTLTVGDPVFTKVGEDETSDEAVFANTYIAAETTYTIEGTKTFFKGNLKANMFSFDLYAASVENGVWTRGDLLETVKNDADGKFAFEEQVYTATGTYYFMVVENAADSIDGVIYDNTVYLVTVNVTDDGEGKLVATDTIQKQVSKTIVEEIIFNNTYVPKTGDNRDLGLWTAMLALCATGFMGLTIMKKKEEAEE